MCWISIDNSVRLSRKAEPLEDGYLAWQADYRQVAHIKQGNKVVLVPLEPEVNPLPPLSKRRRKYKNLVLRLTERNAALLPLIELRSWRGYHIDHIVSIYQGFRLSINPHLIASPCNLRVISMKDNLDKGQRLTDESNVILQSWGLL